MEVTWWHGIQYDVTEPVAVEDLIKSLEANARLLKSAGTLLESLIPGLKIEPKRVSVVELSQQSPLSELFAYALVMVFQKDLEKDVPKIIEQLTGIHIAEQYDTVVTVLVALIAIQGIGKAYDLLFPGKDKTPIESAKASLLARAAQLTGIAAERILGALTVLFTGRQHRVLVGASQKVFAPTRGQRAAIRSGKSVLIEADAVSQAQAAAGLPYDGSTEDEKPKTSSEFHRNVRVILHAMDKDHKKSGWAGHIPSISDDRLPMDLEKSVKPETIFGKGEITGDILLILEEDENGDMKPKEFLLIQAYL